MSLLRSLHPIDSKSKACRMSVETRTDPRAARLDRRFAGLACRPGCRRARMQEFMQPAGKSVEHAKDGRCLIEPIIVLIPNGEQIRTGVTQMGELQGNGAVQEVAALN